MEGRRSTRLAESRTNEMLKHYNMEYISPLDLPPGVERDGYKYAWGNREVPHQIETMVRQGWQIVPSDRAPSYSMDPLKRNANLQEYLWYMDVILMEIPEGLAKKTAAQIQQRTDLAINSLTNVHNDSGAYGRTRSINSF